MPCSCRLTWQGKGGTKMLGIHGRRNAGLNTHMGILEPVKPDHIAYTRIGMTSEVM